MGDGIYRSEPIVGHCVEAELEERPPSTTLQQLAESLDVPLRGRPDFVRITESDVDWVESRSVKVNVNQLREMALQYTDLEDSDMSTNEELSEGDEVSFDELPDSELYEDGTWEMVDARTIGGMVGDKYITAEFSAVEITDVRDAGWPEDDDE